MKLILITLLLSAEMIFSQQFQTPLEKNNYDSLTSYSQMISYLQQTIQKDKRIKLDYIAETIRGRKVPVLFISDGKFGEDTAKIKILIFAQQHGNEQSGKEGTLLLLEDIMYRQILMTSCSRPT